MNDYLIDDIRRTLRTAAERIDVTPPSFDSSIDTQPVKAVTPRWVWPTAAAAAVIAVALVLVAFAIPAVGDRRLATAATAVTITGGIGDVGGVRFPVPKGWTVSVTSSTDDVVTACVALTPTSACDGVQLTLAVPDSSGSGEPLPTAELFVESCVGTAPHDIQIDETVSAVGGRPAVHYRSDCGSWGPEQNLWQLSDLTLFISTPAGRWAAEGALVADGTDLSDWPVQPGPQRAFMAPATSGG